MGNTGPGRMLSLSSSAEEEGTRFSQDSWESQRSAGEAHGTQKILFFYNNELVSDYCERRIESQLCALGWVVGWVGRTGADGQGLGVSVRNRDVGEKGESYQKEEYCL